MKWRNREKRNDQEHHEKASFFHIAELQNGFFYLVFEKMSSSLPMLLFMLFAHVRKRSNSLSQMFFKTVVLKDFPIFTGKYLCWKPLFKKVSGLKDCIFIQKETPTQVLFCEYCETFTNSFFIEDLFITYCSEILSDDI